MLQGCSQTSKQDEASFERSTFRRHKVLEGSEGMPPRKFWNLEAQKCSCKHFPWYFSSEKSILSKSRSSLFYCLAILVPKMTICILKHLKNRYSWFTWNELTSLKCFSPQFILVFTSDDVRVRVLIRRVQHDDPVKTVFWFLLWLCRVRSSEKQVVWIASRSGRAKSILPLLLLSSLDKTANNAQSYHWFPREIKSVEWVWKFRTDDASLPRSG